MEYLLQLSVLGICYIVAKKIQDYLKKKSDIKLENLRQEELSLIRMQLSKDIKK